MIDALFIVHVGITILGVVCFFGAFVSSWLYLYRQRQLKKKRPSRILPSLEQLDRWAWRSVVLGFLALTLGITMGLFLAHVAWPDGWITDPKVTLSLMTWIWCFLTLLLRGKFGWRGTRFFIFIVIGFVLTLVIFFGFSIYGSSGEPTLNEACLDYLCMSYCSV